MKLKKLLCLVIAVIMVTVLAACGGTKNQASTGSVDKSGTIASLLPNKEKYISQYKESGLTVDGENEDYIFRGLWNDDYYYRTHIDLSGLSDEQPWIYTRFNEETVKKGYELNTSFNGISNRFSYLFEPISVYLNNFPWSLEKQELLEKLLKNCSIEEKTTDEGITANFYSCEYTENYIKYNLDFCISKARGIMSLSIKVSILDTDIKYSGLEKIIDNNKTLSDTVAVGDTIEFGRYEQDKNTDNGKEKIEWYVLEVQENKALLFSKYVLDGLAYKNSNDFQVFCDGYHVSDVRTWLNDTFYNSAFDENERNIIQKTQVSYEVYEGFDVASKGNVQDKVFILGKDEIPEDFYIKIAFPTEFASYKSSSSDNMFGTSAYWCKNAYIHQGTCVTDMGGIGSTEFKYNYGIRPAIWVKIGE